MMPAQSLSSPSQASLNASSSSSSTVQALPLLKVITLNIWGIKGLSSRLEERIHLLKEALKKDDYDVVALQEVWSEKHYIFLKDELKNVFNYSFYFHSGIVGSGCCIFSKYFIEDVFSYRFSLNGSPFKIYHGDWFGGKLVGLATINYFDYRVNVYVTHLHANYDEKQVFDHSSDEYLPHRITQLYELSQFIEKTSHNAHLSILMGDLNTHETELGFKLLKNHARLVDTFRCMPESQMCQLTTCYSKSNCFTAKSAPKHYQDGIRIDYIMFRSNHKDVSVECRKCEIRLRRATTQVNYSDHEAVYAEFAIEPNPNKNNDSFSSMNNNNENDWENDLISAYQEAHSVIKSAISTGTGHQILFVAVAVICITLIALFNNSYPVLTLFKNVLLTFLLILTFLFVFVFKAIERKQLKNCLFGLESGVNRMYEMIKQKTTVTNKRRSNSSPKDYQLKQQQSSLLFH